MGVQYSSAAGYGVVFSEDELVKFVKDKSIYVQFDPEDCWECAEAVSREYNLDLFYAGDSMTGDGLDFLFGTGRKMDEYGSDSAFQFNEILVASKEDEYAIQALSEASGKKPAFYAGMHVG
jgi:hypothetical protein